VRTLPGWTDSTTTVYETAAQLFDALALDRPRIRLVGVKCENLRGTDEIAEQLSFDDLLRPAPPRPTDTVLDAARERFGARALGFATLLRPPGTPAEPDHLPVPDDDR
jgi:DNA polymerase-4